MKYILVIAFLSIALIASPGLKTELPSWKEIRAQQQADSTVYQAVLILDSIYKTNNQK